MEVLNWKKKIGISKVDTVVLIGPHSVGQAGLSDSPFATAYQMLTLADSWPIPAVDIVLYK